MRYRTYIVSAEISSMNLVNNYTKQINKHPNRNHKKTHFNQPVQSNRNNPKKRERERALSNNSKLRQQQNPTYLQKEYTTLSIKYNYCLDSKPRGGGWWLPSSSSSFSCSLLWLIVFFGWSRSRCPGLWLIGKKGR